MKNKIIIFFIFSNFSLFPQEEMKYNSNIEGFPNWVKLLYAENINEGAVIAAYNKYHKNHELIKNKHSQYYKRWLRNYTR